PCADRHAGKDSDACHVRRSPQRHADRGHRELGRLVCQLQRVRRSDQESRRRRRDDAPPGAWHQRQQPHADAGSEQRPARRSGDHLDRQARGKEGRRPISLPDSIAELEQLLAGQHYVADHGLAVSLFLALRLRRPLFIEGEAGVGKTALATAVAAALGTDLIRLQCYEGLDVGHALYEWDYARQLLELRILDATHTLARETARQELYSETFLLKRPLLQAIDPRRTRPAVLLIDEID